MARATFENLEPSKKERLQKELRKFFEETPVESINVTAIVKTLGIARGSFYQYFDDLDDCYFTVLKEATGQVHHVFLICLKRTITIRRLPYGRIRTICWKPFTITI